MNARVDAPEDSEDRLNQVLGAYLEFADAGCAPDQDEFLRCYPDLAGDLGAFFAAQEKVAECAGTLARTGEDNLDPFDEYEQLQPINKGAYGVVFKAWHKVRKQWVAIKKIKKGRLATRADVGRFRAEIEAAAHLDHPHIVPIYDVREYRGFPYFSMKLFEKGSLQDNLSRFTQDQRAAARLLATAARAVHHAHQHGILHRDLKPGNILLDAREQPHVADFGLAKRLYLAAVSGVRRANPTGGSPADTPGPKETTPEKPNGEDLDVPATKDFDVVSYMALERAAHVEGETETAEAPAQSLTPSGAIVGTFGYLPPEHAPVGPEGTSTAADVYSLGAILYTMLTGRVTFESRNIVEAIRQVHECEPKPPRELNPKIDSRLEAVCMKCLQKSPENRYASAEALAEDLERWLRGEPPLAWPMPWRLRAWRAVRSHLLVSLLTALGAFAAAALFFVFYYFDPDRIPRALERESQRGRVTLIGTTGPPAWSRWNLGEGTVMVSPERDKEFSFTTLERGRAELMRKAPGPRYRFSAEVRHDKVLNNAGVVGIYFGYLKREINDEVEQYWCDITFADEGLLSRSSIGPDPTQKYSVVQFALQHHLLPRGFGTITTEARKVFLSAQQSGQKNDWRKLAVEVTPEKVQLYWEGQPLQGLSPAELRNLCQQAGNVAAPAEYKFAPEGALGLYVFQGKASFRQVKVEPLD